METRTITIMVLKKHVKIVLKYKFVCGQKSCSPIRTLFIAETCIPIQKQYYLSSDTVTTIHHVFAKRRGGNWRGSSGRLSRAPAENQQVKVQVKVKVKVEFEVEVEVKVEVRWGESCLA